MKTSTVKAVTANGTYDSDYGVPYNPEDPNSKKGFYKFEYEMSDGTILTANHKNTVPFDIGAEVEYEIKGTNDYGSWGTVKKPENDSKTFKKSPDQQDSIEKQSVLRSVCIAVQGSSQNNSEDIKKMFNELLPLIQG